KHRRDGRLANHHTPVLVARSAICREQVATQLVVLHQTLQVAIALSRPHSFTGLAEPILCCHLRTSSLPKACWCRKYTRRDGAGLCRHARCSPRRAPPSGPAIARLDRRRAQAWSAACSCAEGNVHAARARRSWRNTSRICGGG